MNSREKAIINVLLYSGIIIAFIDESIRKILPGQPVMVTAVKDAFWLAAGFLAFELYKQELGSFVKFFLCWTLFAIASCLYMLHTYGSILGFLASLKVYVLLPLWFSCGYYLGKNDDARGRFFQLFMLGSVLAIILTFLQEFARDSLPGVFSTRTYVEMHALAGGSYNESLFATSVILAAVLLYAAVISLIWFSGQKRMNMGLSVWGLPGLAVIFASIVLSRARTFLLLGGMFLFVIWVLAGYKEKTDKSHGAMRKLAGSFGILFGFAGALILVFIGEKDPEGGLRDQEDKLGRDIDFFRWLIDPQDLFERLTWFIKSEAEDMKEDNLVFGYGAGAGSLQEFYPDLTDDIPIVYDTGLFQITLEFGVFGLFFFLLLFGGLTIICFNKIVASSRIPPSVLPMFALNLVFLICFLVKSRIVLRNGFSQFIWLSSLGICCALLNKCQFPSYTRSDVAAGEP